MIRFSNLLFAASAIALIAVPTGAQTPPLTGSAEQAADQVIDLSLEDAILIARERSFRAARSGRNQEMANLRYSNAKSAYYPRADVRANADQSARGFQYNSDRFDNREPTRGEFRSGLSGNVSMPIDLFGVVKRQVSQADLQRQNTGFEVQQSVLDVTLEVQNNYLNALRAQIAVDAEEKVVQEIERLLEHSRASAPSSVPFLQVELANAQQSLSSSRTSADQAQDGLRQTLRVPPETRLRLTSRVTDRTESFDPGELLQRALATRPDIQQADNRVKQAEVTERQVSDHRKPNVGLSGFYGDTLSANAAWEGDRDRFRSHGGGLTLNVPLAQYDNGQLGRQKQIARIQREQALSDATEARERVAYEIRQALLAVQRAENRLKTLPDPEQALQSLRRAEQLMLSAPDGQAQALLAQVSNARNAWRSAITASADAYIDYNNAVFRLKKTIGEGYEAAEGHTTPDVALADLQSFSGGR